MAIPKGLVLFALTVALSGCGRPATLWRAETVPVVAATAAAPAAPRPSCPAIDPAIITETQRVTQIRNLQDADALTAALMGSEAAKNASLARLARTYENCRRRGGK